jgi:hypothetical protein
MPTRKNPHAVALGRLGGKVGGRASSPAKDRGGPRERPARWARQVAREGQGVPAEWAAWWEAEIRMTRPAGAVVPLRDLDPSARYAISLAEKKATLAIDKEFASLMSSRSRRSSCASVGIEA